MPIYNLSQYQKSLLFHIHFSNYTQSPCMEVFATLHTKNCLLLEDKPTTVQVALLINSIVIIQISMCPVLESRSQANKRMAMANCDTRTKTARYRTCQR
jgi:hypothetical protein